MNLSRRTYYYKPKKKPSDKALIERMEQICLDFPKYGYRRVTEQIKREGWIINHKKVHASCARKAGLSATKKKNGFVPQIATTSCRCSPNLIKDLTLNGINQLWVADITYIHILVCFIYLAVILDVYSRKAIGYAISRNIDTQLTFDALRMAIVHRNPHRLYSPFRSRRAVCVRRLCKRA